jgi:hypothetical protein
MAMGEIQQIQDLLEQIDTVLYDEAEDIHCLDSMSPNKRLTIGLQSLGQFIAIFLRTSNLSKYLGLLSGKRREPWREALQWIYAYNQPVRINDLCKEGIFSNDSIAGNALNQLASIGLLEKRKGGAKWAIYELTWSGWDVGKILQTKVC